MLPDGPGGIWVVFEPLLVGALIGFVVVIAAMGYASLRTLRGQPDFEHKAEMIWGAR